MSYFQRRHALQIKRQQEKEQRRKEREAQRGLEVDAQLRQLEEAYAEAHPGERLVLHYQGGWVYVGRTRQLRMRLIQVPTWIAELRAMVHEKELDAPQDDP